MLCRSFSLDSPSADIKHAHFPNSDVKCVTHFCHLQCECLCLPPPSLWKGIFHHHHHKHEKHQFYRHIDLTFIIDRCFFPHFSIEGENEGENFDNFLTNLWTIHYWFIDYWLCCSIKISIKLFLAIILQFGNFPWKMFGICRNFHLFTVWWRRNENSPTPSQVKWRKECVPFDLRKIVGKIVLFSWEFNVRAREAGRTVKYKHSAVVMIRFINIYAWIDVCGSMVWVALISNNSGIEWKVARKIPKLSEIVQKRIILNFRNFPKAKQMAFLSIFYNYDCNYVH